jgi:hypothetical protein
MPVFYCAHCSQPIDADETLAGTEVGCPGCYAVIQVPGTAPAQEYQPYQPPVFAQAPGRPSASSGPHSSAPDKWRIWAPVLGTGVTSILCLLKKLGEPTSSLDVALGNTGLPSLLGGAIGYTLAIVIFALVLALVIAAIAAACKKSFLTVLTRSYGIVAVLFSLLMMVSMQNPRTGRAPLPLAQSSQSNQRTQEELNKLQEDMQRGLIPGNGATPSKTTTPPADDASDVEKMVLVTRQYFEELAALQKSYTEELDKIGFTRLMNTQRVMADTDFSESEDILARARVLVKKQGDKMRESLASLPAKIRASNMSPAEKENGALNAEKGTPEAIVIFNETWGLEESVVDQLAAIMDLLRKRRGHWQVSNDLFLFNDPSDLAVFNAAMGKITAAAARQTEIQQQGKQKTGKVFDDLRTALPK